MIFGIACQSNSTEMVFLIEDFLSNDNSTSINENSTSIDCKTKLQDRIMSLYFKRTKASSPYSNPSASVSCIKLIKYIKRGVTISSRTYKFEQIPHAQNPDRRI